MWRNSTLILFLILGTLHRSCNHVNKNEYMRVDGILINHRMPLMMAEVFEPGVISTEYQNNSSPSFTPDMNEVYWSISFLQGSPDVILYMKKENNKWSQPEVAPFSGKYNDGAPFISPNGKKLFFHSSRPLEGSGEPKDFDIWFVEKSENGWSTPQNLGKEINSEKSETYPSVSKNNNLYFNSYLEGHVYDIGIFKSRFIDGEYKKREILDENINSKRGFNWCPFIDPDEQYILFSSGREGQEYDDIYISYLKSENLWSEPVKLGNSVNSEFNDRFPGVSPDGKYLFFSRPQSNFRKFFKATQPYKKLQDYYNKIDDDIYWVSSSVINEINNQNSLELQNNYPDMNMPNTTPRLFAPEIISTKELNERDLSFSPNGKQIYFSRSNTAEPDDYNYDVYYLEYSNNEWSKPKKAWFSTKYGELETFFTPDGESVFFNSNRPCEGEKEQGDWETWVINKQDGTWSSPKQLFAPFNRICYANFTQNGKMYYTKEDIPALFWTDYKNGNFGKPMKLDAALNSAKLQYNCFIAPDESYIVFTKHSDTEGFGDGDLYVSFNNNNKWSKPKNLGPKINSKALETCPNVSNDGKFLFFTSNKRGNNDVYWVSTNILKELTKP